MSSSLLHLLSFLLLFSLALTSPLITLPLHRLSTPAAATTLAATPDPFHQLAAITTSSLLRARHLKSPTRHTSNHHLNLGSARLTPQSYGGYSISLSFGTPPQSISLVFDTGSDLTWAPCTRSYLCKNCPSSNLTPTFLPKSSSSVRLIGCRNPKCQWVHSPERLSRCQKDSSQSQICPTYFMAYGKGSTGGILLDETLVLPRTNVSNFVFGCSVFSSQLPPAGIAGFGDGPASIPSQLHLERFSYCLISRQYDDVTGKAGEVELGGDPESSHLNVSFTPFVKNLAAQSGSPFSIYYYVELSRIAVGGKKVKIPPEVFLPGSDGNGGTIVDSGSTFTYVESDVLDLVIASFVDALAGRYARSPEAEKGTGLRLCFAVTEEKVTLPALVFHFKGGARMEIPAENYFAVVNDAKAMCLMVVSDNAQSSIGPAIILGAFQQQNYHMMFDIQRQRLGFRKQNCDGKN